MNKVIICPKCHHVRPKDATNPEWQCPACGVCYAKVGKAAEPVPEARMRERLRAAPEPFEAKQPWNRELIAAVVAGVLFVWGVSKAIGHRQQPAEAAEVQVAQAEQKNARPEVSSAEVDALTDVGNELQKACARNKYGLSTAECRETIHKRGDACANQTAARFHGQFSNTNSMDAIGQDYVHCIFES